MYVSDTASYDKGTLMDVMHLGDYGWMQINEFLVEQFLENE
jgi:poly-D-alanine transfer protein DltD